MRRILPSILILASGCLPRLEITVPAASQDSGGTDGGALDGGADGGSDTGLPGAPTISTIDPTDGPTNGGQVVAILGGPYDASVQVTFDQRGATLATLAEDRITVVAPPSADGESTVDVTVRTNAGTVTRKAAYTYWDNANGDTALVGMWLQLVLAGTDTLVNHESWVRFIDPQPVTPPDRYGIGLDGCGTPSNGLTSRQGPDSVLLGTANAQLELAWSGERVEYAWDGTTLPDLVTEEYLSLSVPASAISPALELDEVVRTETPVAPTSPDLSLDAPELPSEAAEITWTAGDHPYVLILGATDDGTEFLCLAADDGAFVIPADHFADLPFIARDSTTEIAPLYLGFARVARGEADLEYNAGLAMLDAGVGVLGAVTVSRSTGEEVAE